MNTRLSTTALITLALLLGCQRQASQGSRFSPPPRTVSTNSGADVTFERKVACHDAQRTFVYNAMSPRDGVYRVKRGCYVPALNTCVVEYEAPPHYSATIFDILTGETLAVYLNYPGNADEVYISDRLKVLGKEAPTLPEEEMTQERREYAQNSARVFASCAE